MKKTLFTAILIFVGTIVIVESCQKDDPAPTANVLCNGSSKTSFFPLDSANNWNYDYSMSSESPDLKITGHTTFSSKVYAVLVDASDIMYSSAIYLREDAVNHNIYCYNDLNSTEYLVVPASPQLNQSWEGSSIFTKKVTNLSASVKTAKCSYIGLLEISEYDGTDLVGKYYYKKGLGLVCRKEYAFFTSTYELYSVTLH